MAVGMTEANINPSAETDWRYEGMLGGVYWASELVHFILQNCSLAVFFTATGDDNYAALTDRAKPSYQSILLFAKHAKVVGKQWLKTSYPEINANLETLALADDKEFSLLAVNKDTRGTAFKAKYKLSNLPALDGSLHAWGIRDGHLEATDLGTVPVSQGEINVTFPPFSVTVLTGRFQKPRKAAALLKAEPTSASQGLAVLGQYSWNGLPARIAKAPAGVRLTADLAAFSGVPAIQLDGKDPAKVVGAKLGSPGDLRASLRLMRDDKNLYLACEVRQGRGPLNKKWMNELWNADSLELDISSKSDLAYKSRLKKSDWDYQICLAPDSVSGKPAIICYNAAFSGMEVVAKAVKDGYDLAAKIPLSNFADLDWAPGKKLRFDVAVARAGKDGNRETKLYWNATSDAWDSPDEWGLAEIQ